MSNRSKKTEEELQLRLLAITEDPTFQGRHDKDRKRIFGMVIGLDAEDQRETKTLGNGTIH